MAGARGAECWCGLPPSEGAQNLAGYRGPPCRLPVLIACLFSLMEPHHQRRPHSGPRPPPPAHCCHRALALSRGTLACALSVGTLFSLASCRVAGIKIFAENACDRDPGRAGVLVCTTANHRTGRTRWTGRLKQRLRLPSVPEAGGLRPELRVSSLVPWFTDGRLLPLSSRGLSLHACARIPHLRRAPAMVDKGPPNDPI